MMLSLLESILVMYLMEKESPVQDDGREAEDKNLKDENSKRSSKGECDILLQEETVVEWRGPLQSDQLLCICINLLDVENKSCIFLCLVLRRCEEMCSMYLPLVC